ncbi:unnamed protein product [Anisakis simplex]|uniref:Serine rich protein interaction domain-containing protein n=1 Tax=Anisakis simplex TaxID=6269 RepID=A0A3P6NYN8_ANISI|nr:unnamed protein product [Anisakis simplex]
MSAKKMAECTAPKAWRQPHVLQQHLSDIKEAVVTITACLDEFLNATGRITVDKSSPKADDLQHLLTPLRNSHSMIKQLKQNIDYTGWTLAALSRPKSNMASTTNGNDALDQFVAVIKQLLSSFI